MEVAARSDCGVTIVRILGMTTDTNPTIVAAAAADATWNALGFAPRASVRQRVESVVLRSWEGAVNSPLLFA